MAVLLRGETFYKKEECHPPNIGIVKGCQKETFLLLREGCLGVIVCCEDRVGVVLCKFLKGFVVLHEGVSMHLVFLEKSIALIMLILS